MAYIIYQKYIPVTAMFSFVDAALFVGNTVYVKGMIHGALTK